MRLIDADALIEFIDNRYDITWADDYEGGIKDACTDILDKINAMPTIEPERTGKWIYHPEWQADGECGYECDQCGKGSDENYDYCPRCGAWMRMES